MNEQELNNINQIDMECHIVDDDDLIVQDIAATDDREVQSKTGIIINFDDDDDVPARQVIADTSTQNSEININSNFLEDTFQDYNSIDMETKYSEDDEEELISTSDIRNPIFFDPNESNGLISTEMLEESKHTVSFGEVEDDYWEKLSKKHKKTNKKGAYNTSFHFAGNPKKEQDMFNHMMGTADNTVDVADLISSDSLLSASASTATSNTTGIATSGEGSGEGCCESITTTDYSKKLNDLFDIIGFEVFKNSDNSYVAIDKCDILPELNVKNLLDLISALKPYIDDCLIYPLQISTNNIFDNYKDWVDWYNTDMQKAFPKCAKDIEYCDLLANHLHECVIE